MPRDGALIYGPDQSTRGAVTRVKRHMGNEAEGLLQGRVRIIKYAPEAGRATEFRNLTVGPIASGDRSAKSGRGRWPFATPEPCDAKTS